MIVVNTFLCLVNVIIVAKIYLRENVFISDSHVRETQINNVSNI